MSYGEQVFFWHERTPGLERAFTDVNGEVSSGAHPSLDLGGGRGDGEDMVETSRARLAESLGLQREQLLFMRQCHGSGVAVVTGPWCDAPPSVDALVTTTAGLALAVLVADCTPVLLSDEDKGVIAAAHAGRPGMLAGVIGNTVEAMRRLGSTRIHATVGPSVCGRCYEVPERMRDHAAKVVPESVTVSWTGTPAIDVAAGVVSQLRANDVAVHWVPGCTRESARLYSYRRDGTTARNAGVVMMRPR